MTVFLAVTFCLLVALEPVNCQRGKPVTARGNVHRSLQPWMQGVIALTVFLVLAMVAFVINRLWCQDKDNSLEEQNKELTMTGNKEDLVMSNGTEGRYSTAAADFRSEEGHHVYENKVELECENATVHDSENSIPVLTTCM